MKRLSGLIAVFVLMTSMAAADTEFTDFFSRLEFQTYGGLSVPTDNSFFHLFNVGTNEGASLGYRLDKSFSILLDENLHSFSSSDAYYLVNGAYANNVYKSITEDIFELAVLAKYRLPAGPSRIDPYFFAGGGVAWNSQYYVLASNSFSDFNNWSVNPLLEAGVGLQWAATDVIGLFAQQKLSVVFNPSGNFVVDSPIDYLSFEAGLNISLN